MFERFYGEHLKFFSFVSLWIYPFFPLFHQAISNRDQHSISYTLSRVQTVVVEYTHDSNTDMFQVTPGLGFYNQPLVFPPHPSKWNNLVISTLGLIRCLVVWSSTTTKGFFLKPCSLHAALWTQSAFGATAGDVTYNSGRQLGYFRTFSSCCAVCVKILAGL